MADGQADTGSVVPATSAAATAAAPNGSDAAAPDWRSGLSEGNRSRAEAKGWATADDAIASYAGLEAKLGQTLTVPSSDAPTEAWDKFFAKVGRPEKPEGYEFKLPEGLPENLPYSADDATKYKNWAHAEGLTPKQAQALHDEFVKDTAGRFKGAQEAREKAATSAHETLVKTWGDPSSETYKREQELANRSLRQLGGSDLISELKSVGVLDPNGVVLAPKLAIALARVGKELYAEDSLFSGPSSAPNPFSPKSENMTEQGKLIAADPSRARQMMIAAGVDPKEYGMAPKA